MRLNFKQILMKIRVFFFFFLSSGFVSEIIFLRMLQKGILGKIREVKTKPTNCGKRPTTHTFNE